MFMYSIKKGILERVKRAVTGYAYAKGLLKGANYTEVVALIWFSDVKYYSKDPDLREVPARNGILLPVKFFNVTEVSS